MGKRPDPSAGSNALCFADRGRMNERTGAWTPLSGAICLILRLGQGHYRSFRLGKRLRDSYRVRVGDTFVPAGLCDPAVPIAARDGLRILVFSLAQRQKRTEQPRNNAFSQVRMCYN